MFTFGELIVTLLVCPDVCIVFFQIVVFKSSSIRSTLSCWAVGKDYKEIFCFCQQWPHQTAWNLSPVCAQLLGKSQTSHLANWCCSSWCITSYWISLFQSLWGKVQINVERFVFFTHAVHSLVSTNTCGLSWARLGYVHAGNSLGGTSRNDQTCFLKDFFIINFEAFTYRVCSRCGNNNCNRKRSFNVKQSGEHSRRIIFKKKDFFLHPFPDFWAGLALCLWIERLSGD